MQIQHLSEDVMTMENFDAKSRFHLVIIGGTCLFFLAYEIFLYVGKASLHRLIDNCTGSVIMTFIVIGVVLAERIFSTHIHICFDKAAGTVTIKQSKLRRSKTSVYPLSDIKGFMLETHHDWESDKPYYQAVMKMANSASIHLKWIPQDKLEEVIDELHRFLSLYPDWK